MFTTLIQLVGFVCLAAAAFLVAIQLGLLIAGIELLLIGHALDGVKLRFPKFRKAKA